MVFFDIHSIKNYVKAPIEIGALYLNEEVLSDN
jgi:hypothetical protein